MDELTNEQVTELKQVLAGLRGELKQLLAATKEGTRPVGLDEPIGRLTRMDAMQQQSMSAANRRSHDLRLQQVNQALNAIERDEYGFWQVNQALNAIERDEYGFCRRCDDPIGYKRLTARPESPYCLGCQDAIDRKHS